ncbi:MULTISPECIES: cation diffusion facilitator family transporter [Acidiphilium]|jgi:cation diffusion facilitator family transporter|uniref:cation diffusion facilitator family transporter n=1 Tax=Acidiphilium TaxID=522 RepID=UPI0002145C3D|nr:MULTISPECIES: cation diffusion facilitator family transporter [Acidiphilium]EGO94553.1 Cation diffusion facilitator family transporter [Acidiphilium sp. PM]MBS3024305.1 cation transporter [Acidiphilium multivorum]
MRVPFRLAAGSVAIGFVSLGLKAAAWRVSHSAALYSDALESLVNVFAAVMVMIALKAAAKPADSEHPYGHAKAELLSAVAEGGMIIFAAVLILERAASTILAPRLPVAPELGLGLNAAGGVVNALWALALGRSGATRKFPALAADQAHLIADAITTLGIIGGLSLAILANLPVLDPLIAIAVAAQIAFMGGRTVLRALSALLDRAPPPEMVERIRHLVAIHAAGAIEAHDMRMREAGQSRFLEFHLVVPGGMTVAESHAICDRIEAALRREMAGVIITIHVEPDNKAKHEGIMVK